MSMFDIIMGSAQPADIIGMSRASAGMEIGGQVVNALQRIKYGREARRAAEFQAAQLEAQANNVAGSAQRAAINDQRQADLVASRALALAAAGGGGASDPTVVNLIANNAGESAYRKAVSLYDGEAQAQQLRLNAQAKRYEGAQIQGNESAAGVMQLAGAVPSVLRATAKDSSMLQKFGMNSKLPTQTQAEGSVRDWYVYD